MALRWGIIGSGTVCNDFANVLNHLPDEEHFLVGVAASKKEKAEKFAKKHNITIVYDSFKALSREEEIDVVYVGTISPMHHYICKMLLNNKKHVLCEKPLCIKYEHTKELVRLAEKKKLFLMEGIWSRFYPLYDDLPQLLSSNKIGDVKFLKAVLGVPISSLNRVKTKEFGGGTIFDLGASVLQLAILVFGNEPEIIHAIGHLNENGVDESIEYILKYNDGKMASFCTHSQIKMDNSAVIYGTKGYIKIKDPFWAPTVISINDEDENRYSLPRVEGKRFFTNSQGLIYEVREVGDCIKKGLIQSPKMSHEDTLTIAKWQAYICRLIGSS